MKKPVVYLYPEKKEDIEVSVAHPERLTSSYPEYDGSWHVTASPDGTLVDDETGRSLYALYYEGRMAQPDDLSDGFVVQRDDLIPFLEEKLSILGLTEREAEEMIVYWLPQMQTYDSCHIRFSLTEDEQQQNALNISPEPEHLIRIRMVWKGMDNDDPVYDTPLKEQRLTPVDRDSMDGFVAVEWGGTELTD